MTAQTCVFRTAIVLGMCAAVLTILYLTPIPDQYFLSCDRPCHDFDWPMICRLKLNVEMYQTMSPACMDCPSNASHCTNEQCSVADGVLRPILTANRQLPGPVFHVCQNDVLVVDVTNKLPGQNILMHWRGQPQDETPFMDGVPMVSQCPIPSFTTFQYKFRASVAGTHLWEAYSGSDAAEGLSGAIVVRQAQKLNIQKDLYDYDKNEHVIVISGWSHQLAPRSIYAQPEIDMAGLLMNGRGKMHGPHEVPLQEFVVEPSKRYRFRVAYTHGFGECAVRFSIDKHKLQIISIDGHPIIPRDVMSIVFNKGERIDFVLTANHVLDSYRIRVEAVNCGEQNINVSGILRYNGSEGVLDTHALLSSETNLIKKKGQHLILSGFCAGDFNNNCVDSIRSLEKLPVALRAYNTRKKLFFSYGKQKYLGHVVGDMMHMNNLTFTFPSSPMFSQTADIDYSMICNQHIVPPHCRLPNKPAPHICECVHVEKIDLGDTVEIILADQEGDLDHHTFHLHGYSFWVVGANQFTATMSLNEIKDLDDRGLLFNRNLLNPIRKDTVTVPRFGVVALRFKADNPGYWMLREQHVGLWTRGADVVLQVGEHMKFVPPPSDFPKCGSYVGPDFFLI